MNIYQLTDHLSAVQTQNLLAIALALGAAGVVLANPALFARVYALAGRLVGSQARTQEYASERK